MAKVIYNQTRLVEKDRERSQLIFTDNYTLVDLALDHNTIVESSYNTTVIIENIE